MTLEAIYYIGQTIAVIAILASLFAIYRQQKRTNQIERGKTETERVYQVTAFGWNVVKDDEILQSIRLCILDYTSAHPNDQAKFMAYMAHTLEIFGQAYYQKSHDLIEPSSFEAVQNLCIAKLKTPGGLQWWNTCGKHVWGKDVVGFLTQKIDDPNNAIPPITEFFTYLNLPKDATATEVAEIEPPAQTRHDPKTNS